MLLEAFDSSMQRAGFRLQALGGRPSAVRSRLSYSLCELRECSSNSAIDAFASFDKHIPWDAAFTLL